MKRKPEKATPFAPNDLVLVHVEDKPAFFARIEEVDPDAKAGWWQVKLLILNVPLRVVTWMLDNQQIRGAEFTMGGVPLRLQKVVAPAQTSAEPEIRPREEPAGRQRQGQGKGARILAFKPKSETNSESF